MSNKKTYGFNTEVKQILQLVIHSLYSNREIFLRELISNGLDAVEKLRFKSLNNTKILENDIDFKIRITQNKDEQQLIITDNGIGLSYQEAIENLGTIAKSGTKKFLENLTNDKKKNSQLIGKFGVGFYSAYIIADNVTVLSRKAGLEKNEGIAWESKGDGTFTIEKIVREQRGTQIILNVKKSDSDLLEDWKIRQIIKKYSDHISIPIEMIKIEYDKNNKPIINNEQKWEVINQAKALWNKAKKDISDKEYKEFYKHLSHDFADPLTWSHNKVEGALEYTSLLYFPERASFDLWDRERKSGLQLYVQRVFIMENEDLIPKYLRFIKGIIDSNDLPLNISREILQHNHIINKIKKSITKKILDIITNLSLNDKEKFLKFWKEFGQVLKEGLAEDQDNKEKIAKLLRFSSTYDNSNEQNISLDDYLLRMKNNQKNIYYLTAESFNAAKNNPQLEIFRKNNIEVLLLSDRVDEWMTSHLESFNNTKLKSISKGNLDLEELESDKTKELQKNKKEEFKNLIKQMKECLKEKVEDVRISKRLTDSPSCIVVNDYGMSLHLQKMMSEAGKINPGANTKPILEINIEHKIIEFLQKEQDDDKFKDWCNILFYQALIIEGGQIEDPASFIKMVNKYLTINLN